MKKTKLDCLPCKFLFPLGIVLCIVLLLALFGKTAGYQDKRVSPFPHGVRTTPYPTPKHSEATTKEGCELQGGTWGTWGLAQNEYCQFPAADGGTRCTDGSQCILDKCISRDMRQNGASLEGECQTFPNTFGCQSWIEDGKVSTALCID